MLYVQLADIAPAGILVTGATVTVLVLAQIHTIEQHAATIAALLHEAWAG